MGRITHIAEVAARRAEDSDTPTVVSNALDAVIKRDLAKTRKLMSANPQNKKLRIKQQYTPDYDGYTVYDEDDVVKFSAIKALYGSKPPIKVFDQYANKIGIIKPQLSSLNLPNIKIKAGKAEAYAIKVHGEKIGTVKPAILGSAVDVLKGNIKPVGNAIKQAVYVFDYNDWKIERTIQESIKGTFRIVDNEGELVAVVSKNRRSFGGHYVVDMFQCDREFLCVLLVLTMDLIDEPIRDLEEQNNRYTMRQFVISEPDTYRNRD